MTSNSSACFPERQAVSNGALQGDNPFHFALPLLVVQITLVLIVTRSLAFLFKPIRQPRVLAEIIGGVLLGPSALGRNKAYMNAVFPEESITLLETVSTLGLLFFLFMVGLELDLYEIRKSGKTALLVAATGISVPFVAGIGAASLLHQTISAGVKFAPLVVFMGVPLSITAFPVLVRIMAERKLLTTELGKLVVPTAAMNDLCAWIMLGVGVAISGPSSRPETPVYVMLCGLGFVIFMMVVARRFMEWIAHRASCEQTVSEIYVCITLLGVLVAGFTTDAIGIHPLFGAFFYGLIVPKDGSFAEKLIEKIEDFITVLMLPLFFASSGLKTNLGTINSVRSIGYLVLLFLTAAVGKISGTAIVALSLGMQLRTAFAFGFLMNTKGLAELIILNIGKDLKILNDQTFAILILTCIVSIFMTTPAVVALYKPARKPVPYTIRKLEGSVNRKDEQLRILACVQGTKNVHALLNLVEACRGTQKRALKLYAMNLIELSDRPSAILTLSRSRRDRLQPSPSEDQIFLAFETYGQLTKVPVRLLSATSELADMHEDVCNTAAEKRATIIILPFNFYQREDGTIEYINSGFRAVSQKVLQHSPCSVCVLVDRGFWGSAQLSETSSPQKIAVLFTGGADDREALAFGCRLAEHPNVKLWVLRFSLPVDEAGYVVRVSQSEASPSVAGSSLSELVDDKSGGTPGMQQDESCLDEESLAAVKEFTGDDTEDDSGRSIYFEEHSVHRNPVETALSIAKASDFLLLLVGRRSCHSLISPNQAENHSEISELGLIGDALASAGSEMKASILVIQQHDANLATSVFVSRDSTPA